MRCGKGWRKASQRIHTITGRTTWLQWSSKKGSRCVTEGLGGIPGTQHSLVQDFTHYRALTAGPCMVAGWLNLTVDFQRWGAVQKIGSIWPFSCKSCTQRSCHFSHLAVSVGVIMVLWKRLMALMIWMVVAFLKRKSYMWMEAAVYRPPDCLHLQAPGRYWKEKKIKLISSSSVPTLKRIYSQLIPLSRTSLKKCLGWNRHSPPIPQEQE